MINDVRSPRIKPITGPIVDSRSLWTSDITKPPAMARGSIVGSWAREHG